MPRNMHSLFTPHHRRRAGGKIIQISYKIQDIDQVDRTIPVNITGIGWVAGYFATPGEILSFLVPRLGGDDFESTTVIQTNSSNPLFGLKLYDAT